MKPVNTNQHTERIERDGHKPIAIRFQRPDDRPGDYTDLFIHNQDNLAQTLGDIRSAGYRAWVLWSRK